MTAKKGPWAIQHLRMETQGPGAVETSSTAFVKRHGFSCGPSALVHELIQLILWHGDGDLLEAFGEAELAVQPLGGVWDESLNLWRRSLRSVAHQV